MKRKQHSQDAIYRILKESEAGMKTPELCRKYGISQNTFYRWKSKYGGMEVSDMRRLKELEDENNRLKKLVAEQALDNQAMKLILSKKW
jgi:putative transposase